MYVGGFFILTIFSIYLEDDKERRLLAKDDVANVLSEEFFILYMIRGIPSREHFIQGCSFQGYFLQVLVFKQGKGHCVPGQKQGTYRTKSINRRGRYNAGAFWLLGDVPWRAIQCWHPF